MSRNFDLMQQTLSEKAEAAALTPLTTLPVSQTNGKAAKSVSATEPDKLAREEMTRLVQQLFLGAEADSPRVVMFAGMDTGNGCSQICSEVARILASNTNGTVCLVDANLRAPALPEFFGVSNHFGLTDALAQEGAIRKYAKSVGPDNLWLLSCGGSTNDFSRLLNSEQMKARVMELRKEFDYVIVDVPALNESADAIALGQQVDGLVVVLEANSTRREAASKVVENLRAAKIRTLGAVLNKRTFPIPEALYQQL
jgi:capsular exopolysaccharide synthesis family protein